MIPQNKKENEKKAALINSRRKMERKKSKPKKQDHENKMKALIKEVITEIVGVHGEKIIEVLYKKKNVNEFLISKKLGLTINQTRNILYRLSDKGLVRFIRKKDSKKGGWYTYFWTFNIKKALELLKEQIRKKIQAFEEETQKKRNERFYYDATTGIEYNEEEALEHNFISPETGEVLQLKDNKENISKIEVEVAKLGLLYNDVNQEFEELEKKDEKERGRKMKVEAKKKEEERKAKREKMKRLKKREEAKMKRSGKKEKKKSSRAAKKKKQ